LSSRWPCSPSAPFFSAWCDPVPARAASQEHGSIVLTCGPRRIPQIGSAAKPTLCNEALLCSRHGPVPAPFVLSWHGARGLQNHRLAANFPAWGKPQAPRGRCAFKLAFQAPVLRFSLRP
jgi:hypothetical protein